MAIRSRKGMLYRRLYVMQLVDSREDGSKFGFLTQELNMLMQPIPSFLMNWQSKGEWKAITKFLLYVYNFLVRYSSIGAI
jgi:hypothetical protein